MSRNCFLMTGQAVNLTPGIGFVGGRAFEFTLRGKTELPAGVILKADLFGGRRKGVVGRIDGRIRADDDVTFDADTRGIARERRVPFPRAMPRDRKSTR